MVGHLVVPGLTGGEPASRYGFDGLVVSDSLGMGAIRDRDDAAGSVVRFLAAGGDLAIVDVADVPVAHQVVLDAVADGGCRKRRCVVRPTASPR